jgi:hypothetical protein
MLEEIQKIRSVEGGKEWGRAYCIYTKRERRAILFNINEPEIFVTGVRTWK